MKVCARTIIHYFLIWIRWVFLYFIFLPFPARQFAKLKIKVCNALFLNRIDVNLFRSYDTYTQGYAADISAYLNDYSIASKSDVINKIVLDLGSGLGQYTRQLGELGPTYALGIEFQLKKTLFSGTNKKINGLSFSAGSAHQLPVSDESIDTIFSHTVFEHIPNVGLALSECRRVLRPGGCVLVIFNHLHHRGGHHLFPFVRFPWPLAIVGESELCDFWSKMVIKEKNKGGMGFFEDFSPITSLSEGNEIGLNRLSELQFRKLVRNSGLSLSKSRSLEGAWGIVPRFIRHSRLILFLRGTVFYRLEKPIG